MGDGVERRRRARRWLGWAVLGMVPLCLAIGPLWIFDHAKSSAERELAAFIFLVTAAPFVAWSVGPLVSGTMLLKDARFAMPIAALLGLIHVFIVFSIVRGFETLSAWGRAIAFYVVAVSATAIGQYAREKIEKLVERSAERTPTLETLAGIVTPLLVGAALLGAGWLHATRPPRIEEESKRPLKERSSVTLAVDNQGTYTPERQELLTRGPKAAAEIRDALRSCRPGRSLFNGPACDRVDRLISTSAALSDTAAIPELRRWLTMKDAPLRHRVAAASALAELHDGPSAADMGALLRTDGRKSDYDCAALVRALVRLRAKDQVAIIEAIAAARATCSRAALAALVVLDDRSGVGRLAGDATGRRAVLEAIVGEPDIRSGDSPRLAPPVFIPAPGVTPESIPLAPLAMDLSLAALRDSPPKDRVLACRVLTLDPRTRYLFDQKLKVLGRGSSSQCDELSDADWQPFADYLEAFAKHGEAASSAPLQALAALAAPVVALAASPGRGILVTADAEGLVREWDPLTQALLREIPTGLRGIEQIAYDDQGRTLIMLADGVLHVQPLAGVQTAPLRVDACGSEKARVTAFVSLTTGYKATMVVAAGRLCTQSAFDGAVDRRFDLGAVGCREVRALAARGYPSLRQPGLLRDVGHGPRFAASCGNVAAVWEADGHLVGKITARGSPFAGRIALVNGGKALVTLSSGSGGPELAVWRLDSGDSNRFSLSGAPSGVSDFAVVADRYAIVGGDGACAWDLAKESRVGCVQSGVAVPFLAVRDGVTRSLQMESEPMGPWMALATREPRQGAPWVKLVSVSELGGPLRGLDARGWVMQGRSGPFAP